MATKKRATPRRNRLAKVAAPLLVPVNTRRSKFAATVIWIDAEVVNGDELRNAMSGVAGILFGRQESK